MLSCTGLRSRSRLTLPWWTGYSLRQHSMKDFEDAWPTQIGQTLGFTSSLLVIRALWAWTMPKLCWTWGYPLHKCSQDWKPLPSWAANTPARCSGPIGADRRTPLSPLQMRPILLLCICKPYSEESLRGHHHACCIWPLGGRPHAFPVRPLGGQPCEVPPSMVLLGSASNHLTMLPLPSVHACMPALILPCLLLPLHLQLTYHSPKTCAGAPGWLQSVFLHPSHAHLSVTLCFCPGAKGLLSSLSARPSCALGLMPGMLCMFLHKLRLFLGWLVQLYILLL